MRKFIVVALSLFIINLLSFFIFQKFQIKTLIVISDEDKLNGLNILNWNNLLFINGKKVTDYIKKQNPQIKSASLSKKFPQTVVLQVENRMPVAEIVGSISKMYIDNSGVILTKGRDYPYLPKIQIADITVYPDQKADWRAVKAASYIQEAKKQGIIIEQIQGSDSSNGFSARLSGGTEVLLPYDGDAAIKASSLQVIILRFTIVGKNITRVDLRFDKPVVTLATGEKISSSF